MTTEMSNSKVDVTSSVAEWKIESIGQDSDYRSDVFKVGNWNWKLRVMASELHVPKGCMPNLLIILLMDECLGSDDLFLKAKFVFRVSNFGRGRQCCMSPVHVMLFKKGQPFLWRAPYLSGKVVIEVNFLHLFVPTIHGEEELSSVECVMQKSLQKRLSHMFLEKIGTDVRINVLGYTFHAHKFILAGGSPVFRSMFEHDLREKQSSIVEIVDMSPESFNALLKYLYGVLEEEEFWRHRCALLSAADKYDISDLRVYCEESFDEDRSTDYVLERWCSTWFYKYWGKGELCGEEATSPSPSMGSTSIGDDEDPRA